MLLNDLQVQTVSHRSAHGKISEQHRWLVQRGKGAVRDATASVVATAMDFKQDDTMNIFQTL